MRYSSRHFQIILISKQRREKLSFREEYDTVKENETLEKFAEKYFYTYFKEYESWGNAKDYADNIIRNFRLTRFFYLRGNDYYIDLEPRRKIEIDSILETDNASAKIFASKLEYSMYLGDATQPELPWETKTKLQEVIKLLVADIEVTENILKGKNVNLPQRPQIITESDNTDTLKTVIENLRAYRRTLNDADIHAELQLYEYEGQRQKIIPVTIQQFIEILQYLLQAREQKVGYFLSHKKIQELFDAIISITDNVSKVDDWPSAIPVLINKWGKSIVA